MRVALGQQAQMGGQQLQAVDGAGAVEQASRVELQRLGLEGAQMLVEAGAPDEVDAVSRLQHRLHAARAAAAHQPEMAAVAARHHLQDGARLAMPPGAQDDAFVTPFHRPYLNRIPCGFKTG